MLENNSPKNGPHFGSFGAVKKSAKTSIGSVPDRPSAILLRARVEDAWASFLNQAVEVSETLAKLESTNETTEVPHIILRLGFGSEVKPIPRRLLGEFMLPPANRPIRITPENLSLSGS